MNIKSYDQGMESHLVYGGGKVPVLDDASNFGHVLVSLHQCLVVRVLVLLAGQQCAPLCAGLCLQISLEELCELHSTIRRYRQGPLHTICCI